jgi:hypothetical protein
MAAIDDYLSTVYRNFKLQPSWPPGALVQIGEVGKMQNGSFVRTAHLRDYGVKIRKHTVEAPSMRFASSGGVQFVATASGALSNAVSAIASADAGLKIGFTKRGAIVVVLDPVREEMIDNVDELAEWMATAGRKRLKDDHVIVTHVRRASAGVIAMASAKGAEVQLKAATDLGQGTISLARIGGKFSLVTSSSTEFVSIPTGRSGMTPFFRLLHFQSDRNFFERVLGLDADKKVELSSRRLFREIEPKVGQFPFDKQFLES